MEERKLKEIEFHNKVRDMALRADEEANQYFWSNKKFYAVTRKSVDYYHNWLTRRGTDQKVLDYCCGDGENSILLAKKGLNIVGIDISDVSIENCRRAAKQENVTDRATFHVMDAEKLEFDDNSFDLIVCSGVLHHLDLRYAYPELARVLKPDGEIICIEALANNPIIQLYRKRTPHLRTEWESDHILSSKDLDLAREFFGEVDVRYFHLASLAAVPFRDHPWFDNLLVKLEAIDDFLLSLPAIQTQAWQMIFTLSKPNQQSSQASFVESQKQAEKRLLAGTLAFLGIVSGIWLWYTNSRRKNN